MNRTYFTNSLKFLVAGVLIAWLVLSGRLDFNALLKLLTPYYIAVGFLIVFASLASNNYRWLLLLRGQGFNTNFAATFKLTLIGMFFNLAMPGGVGGDLIKGYYIVQDHADKKMAAATSVFLDRLMGLFSMTCISVAAIALNFEFIEKRHELVVLAASTILLFMAFVFLFATAFSRRVKRTIFLFLPKVPGGAFLARFYDVLASYRSQPGALAKSMLVSVLTQLLSVTFFIIIGSALESREVPISAYAFVVPLGLMAMAAPIAPAGIGVGQAAFLVLFNWYLGYESPLGPASITAYQLVQILLGLLGAYFYFRRKAPNMVELKARDAELS